MKTLSLLSLVVKNNLVEGASAHWWSQRLSAFFLVILASWFIISIGNVADYEYHTINIWISSVLNSLLLSLLAFTMIYHSSLGLEVIIEDYIHVKKTREFLLALNKIFHLIFFIIIAISIFFISTRIQ